MLTLGMHPGQVISLNMLQIHMQLNSSKASRQRPRLRSCVHPAWTSLNTYMRLIANHMLQEAFRMRMNVCLQGDNKTSWSGRMALKLLRHVHACKGGSIEGGLGQDAMCSWIASLPQVALSPVPPQNCLLLLVWSPVAT